MTKDARNLKPGDKVYSTLHFLSSGIREMIVQQLSGIEVWASPVSSHIPPYNEVHRNQDWHLTIQNAERRALDLIYAKELSLEKQRRKLEALKADLFRRTGAGK
jgi:hypothetical protein